MKSKAVSVMGNVNASYSYGGVDANRPESRVSKTALWASKKTGNVATTLAATCLITLWTSLGVGVASLPGTDGATSGDYTPQGVGGLASSASPRDAAEATVPLSVDAGTG